jgi:hypothetical protein
MTSQQAIVESIRRWTLQRAFAYDDPCALPEERFQVGYTDGWRDIILGFGATWEEAFRLADQTPIDTSDESWWGPHPDGIQQRHAAWCDRGADCTCNSIRRTYVEVPHPPARCVFPFNTDRSLVCQNTRAASD